MTKKAALLSLLLCSYGVTETKEQPLLSHDSVQACFDVEDGAWKYAEHYMVYKFDKQIQKNNAHADAASKGIFTATCACLAAKYAQDKNTKSLKDLTFSDALTGVTIFGTAQLAYNYYSDCYSPRAVALDALTSFLQDWSEHRDHMPVAFVPAFDELALRLQEKGKKAFTADQALEFMDFVQEQIKIYFEKRYKKDTKKSTDSVTVMKTVTDIFKNLK